MVSDRGTGEVTVRRALGSIGATVLEEHHDGVVDFALDSMHGIAYLKGAVLRASFFFEFEPDPDEAAAWVDAHPDVPYGAVQLVESDDSTALRYVGEASLERLDKFQVVGRTARAIRAGWMNRRNGSRDITATLAGAGLLRPPVGVGTETVNTYGNWSWGSRYIPEMTLYMFEAGPVVKMLAEHGPFFAMAHAGHGVNSYGLNVVTTGGPFAVYFQHGYGGAYMSPLESRLRINEAYSYLHVLLGASPLTESTNPRWLLVFSELRDICGIVDLEAARARTPERTFSTCDGLRALMRSAAALVPNEDFGNFGAGIEW
jgi:hypothetical protein